MSSYGRSNASPILHILAPRPTLLLAAKGETSRRHIDSYNTKQEIFQNRRWSRSGHLSKMWLSKWTQCGALETSREKCVWSRACLSSRVVKIEPADTIDADKHDRVPFAEQTLLMYLLKQRSRFHAVFCNHRRGPRQADQISYPRIWWLVIAALRGPRYRRSNRQLNETRTPTTGQSLKTQWLQNGLNSFVQNLSPAVQQNVVPIRKNWMWRTTGH